MKVAVITNIVSHYRCDLYRLLIDTPGIDLTVFCQSRLIGADIRTCHEDLGEHVVILSFWGSKWGELTWQRLPIRRLYSEYDVYLFLGNPRTVSTVVWATIFRLFGKPVIIHGHAHTPGANPLTEKLRLLWWRLFEFILVYTDVEADALRINGFAGKKVVGVNNGLNQRKINETSALWDSARLHEWCVQQDFPRGPVLLSVARLVARNQFDMVIRVMPGLLQRYPNLVWCVIGDGPMRTQLEQRASMFGVQEHIRWLGGIYSEDDLAPWFLSADVLIHPGAIGLTLLHAFGYGLPVITHNNPINQGPEFAAFSDRINGFSYQDGDVDSLYDAILSALDCDVNKSREIRANALCTVQHLYNTDIMAQRFLQITRTAFKT